MIECYKNHGVSLESYYSDVNERIGHIIAGTHNGAAKKKSFGDIIDDDGNYIKGKCKGIEWKNDKKLAESRLHIYKTQMIPLNDNMYFNRNSKSKGDFNELVRSFYMDLYGLDLSKIYKYDPYNFHDTEDKKHPLWFPKCMDLVKPLKDYEKLIKYDKYKMLGKWNQHYNLLNVLSFILIPNGGQYPCLKDVYYIIKAKTIGNKSYYKTIAEKVLKNITLEDGKTIDLDKARIGEGLLIKKREAIRDLIETLTISLFIISPDYKTLKNAISLSDTKSKKLRCLIEMVFEVKDE